MPEVLLTQRAAVELEDAYQWWAANRSVVQANRWHTAFIEAMLTLEDRPHRFPLAPENELFPVEVRQFVFGLGVRPTHRAIFMIRQDAVLILRVRHLAQDRISPDDI